MLASLFALSTVAAASLASPVKRANTGPYFSLYFDDWWSGSPSGAPPTTSQIPGWNVLNVAFYLISGPTDMAQGWMDLTASQRSTIKSQYEAAGVKLVASAFGSTDQPTTSGVNPTTMAQTLANFVTTYDLDGIDIDYEDFPAFNGGTAEDWLITLTRELRALLPEPYIISHAPVAPWFTNSGAYRTSESSVGGYLYINQQVGSMIDYYNVQFYNQDDYTTCETLLTQSASFPEASLFQIAANGVPLNKLLIGKPSSTSEADNGYMSPSTLATCVSQAKAQGWDAGLMVWEFDAATASAVSSWVQTAWGGSSSGGGGGGTSGGTNYSGATCNWQGLNPGSGPNGADCTALFNKVAAMSGTFYVNPGTVYGQSSGSCVLQFCNWGTQTITYDFADFATVGKLIDNQFINAGDSLAQCVFVEGNGAQYVQVQNSANAPNGGSYSLSGRSYC